MNDFEELARRSVEAADDSVRRLAVPDIVARRRRRPVVLGLALGVLLLVVGVVVWQSGDDSTPTVVGPATAGVGPAADGGDAAAEEFFRLEWPTSGDLDPPFAVDLAAADRDFPMGTMKVYGRGTPEDPFAESDLMLVTVVEDEETIGELPDERTTVRGKTGWIDPTMLDLGFRSAIGWRETDELIVTVSSRSMTQEELTDLAESLDFEGPEVSFVSSLGLVIDIDSPPVLFAGPGSDGWLLAYSTMPDEGASVSLYGEEAGPEILLLWRYFFAPDGVAVSVRGGQGWLSTSPGLSPLGGGATERLVWSEGGYVVALSVADGLDVLDVAGDLVAVDEERWAELLASAGGLGNLIDGEIELIVQGEFEAEDGTVRWRVAIDESLSLCLATEQANSGSGSCGSIGSESESGEIFTPPGLGAVSASVEAGWLEIQGSVGDEVARVVAEFPDGTAADLDLYASEVLETRVIGWVTPLRQGDGDYELVAFAADGRELERRVLAGFVPSGSAGEVPTPIIPELPEELEGVLGRGTVEDMSWELRSGPDGLCLRLATIDDGVVKACTESDAMIIEAGFETTGSVITVVGAGVAPGCVGSVELQLIGSGGNVLARVAGAVDPTTGVFVVGSAVEHPNNEASLVYRDVDGEIIVEMDARDLSLPDLVC